MDRSEKIPPSAAPYERVAVAIATAFRILDIYDLEALHAALSDRDGMLAFRDPTLFMRVQADPQWEAKCDLIAEASRFTRRVGAILESVEPRL